MTVISWTLGFIPALHSKFYDDNEDLHGFFEYANTYAVFLLIALVTILFNHRSKILSLICAGICIYGICLSKSRAVWLLSIITVLVAAFYYLLGRIKSRKGKISFIIALAVTAGIIILALILTGYGRKSLII
ncbi:MAG: hypothetical protein LUG95_03260 [Clostridiales bacterium]|nr:hypothetical protein [Clostridiales bacterium]